MFLYACNLGKLAKVKKVYLEVTIDNHITLHLIKKLGF